MMKSLSVDGAGSVPIIPRGPALSPVARIPVIVHQLNVVLFNELGPQKMHLVTRAYGHNELVRAFRRMLCKQVRRL